MSHESELEFATQLAVALCYIVDKCNEHEEEYPLMTKAIFTLLFGATFKSTGECPYCHRGVNIESTVPIGGLDTATEVLEECIDALQLEIAYEVPFQLPDYEI